jgi:hypothetical protein
VRSYRRLLSILAMVSVVLLWNAWPRPAEAYIGGPPACLGMMCYWSTHAAVVQVERVDKEKNVIIFRKLRDLKGKWPTDVIRHNIGKGPGVPQHIMQWAEPGKRTVTFALESYKWSHTYVDGLWYAASTADWQGWNLSHAEPTLLRGFSGKTERLVSAASSILAGKEVIVAGMVDGNAEDLRLGRAKVQRLKSSLKLLDYNPKRDFVGWGGDDFLELPGMPGFSHSALLPRVSPEAQAISCVDVDGDGKPDLCLVGAGSVTLLRNDGDAFNQFGFTFPGPLAGCRAAVWADYNGDGRPDLLLATATGPKLSTNLGGTFRDDSHLLPPEPCYNLTAAAWLDYDGDGRPDILLGNGFHGLRLYRNKGKAEIPPGTPAPRPGQPPSVPRWFEDVSVRVGLGPDGIGSAGKGDTLTVCDVDGDGRPDFLYGAGTGMLVLNKKDGFVEARDSGISYKPGRVGPVFGDFDGDGLPDLFVPQAGTCKLFKNDGKGHFTDVTDRAGDLGKTLGTATCAAWGDFDNDGKLDLVVGCLRGHNHFFRNRGDGTFQDATEEIGLHKRIFNTQAVCLVDLNDDGMLDLICNNEGQDSTVLLGNPARAARRIPVTVNVAGDAGVVGSRVRIQDRERKVLASQFIGSGEGRGGQGPMLARFALQPGTYRVEVEYSSDQKRSEVITVAKAPRRVVIDNRKVK